MTDFIYTLPLKLISKKGVVYKDAIYKSASKLLKKKKLVGNVGHPRMSDLNLSIINGHELLQGDLKFVSINGTNMSFKVDNCELPDNYADLFELSPTYLIENNKVTLLCINLIPKATTDDQINK